MKKTSAALLVGAVILCGLSGASAADLGRMPVKAPAPVVAPIYNWNGFYLGGHIGWARAESSWSDDFFLVRGDAKENGFLGGGQIGYNWQFNNILLGIEGQISATDLSGSSTSGPLNAFGDTLSASADLNWIASLTGKLGFTADNWLFYMKGGGAWADVDASATLNVVGIGTFTASRSDTRSGWTVGGGVEWGFAPNWSALLEYQFYDFGDRTFTPALAPAGTSLTVESDIHTVKLGVNYRFGPWR